MFKASKELVGKEDKYVNGYGPEEEEEGNEEEFLDLFIKNEKTIKEDMDELSENLSSLVKEVEESNNIKKELNDGIDEIDKMMDKLEKLINEEESDVKRDTKLIGGSYDPDNDPLLKDLHHYSSTAPSIVTIMYSLIKDYGARHYEINELIKETRAKVDKEKAKADNYINNNKSYKDLKYVRDMLIKLPYNREEYPGSTGDDNKLRYYRRMIEESEQKIIRLKKIREGSDYSEYSESDSSDSPDEIVKYENKIKKDKDLLSKIEEEYNRLDEPLKELKKEKYKDYKEYKAKLDLYQDSGVKAYKNLITKLIEKYNFLDSYLGKNKLNKEGMKNKFTGQYKDVKSRVSAVIDLIQVLDKDKLNEISKEGRATRDLYYQLMQSKYDTDHTKVSANPTKREDGTRSEALFKKYVLKDEPKYKNKPLIDLNQYTFYDKIDFELPKQNIELKMSNKTPDKKQWLYVEKAKVDNLLKQSKKSNIFWYYSPYEGYLADMDKAEFDAITDEQYKKRLYFIKLKKDTFNENDYDEKSKSYRLELEPNEDDRILYLIEH
jgi:hypothetical protein